MTFSEIPGLERDPSFGPLILTSDRTDRDRTSTPFARMPRLGNVFLPGILKSETPPR